MDWRPAADRVGDFIRFEQGVAAETTAPQEQGVSPSLFNHPGSRYCQIRNSPCALAGPVRVPSALEASQPGSLTERKILRARKDISQLLLPVQSANVHQAL